MHAHPIVRTSPHIAVGYLRRSTDRQEQSIPDQKKAIEAYATNHGLRMSRYYTDDAISGTSTIGRRAFQQMMADAQGPRRDFDLIVVYDVKRFGRVGNDEAGYYRHLLRLHGVEVRYVSENFTGDGTDDLLRPVKQWQAREESKDLSKVTIRGLLSKVSGGWWMGGVPPFGYDLRYENSEGSFLLILRYMADGTKRVLDAKGRLSRALARGESLSLSKRDRARLVFSEPHRVELVRQIFSMYVDEHKGFKVIAGTFNQQKIPPPRGPAWSDNYHGQWTDTTIRAILLNPAYVGDMVWNKRTDGKFHSISQGQAKTRVARPGARLVANRTNDWITVKDTHPAIITRRQFEQARQIREGRPASKTQRISHRPPVGGWKGSRAPFILSGLLQCAHCGNRYQGYTATKGKRRDDGSKVVTRSYACGGYITKGATVCKLQPIEQEALEQAVIGQVIDFYQPYLTQSGRTRLARVIQAATGEQSHEAKQIHRKTETQLKRIDKITTNLLDNITAVNREWVDQRLVELAEQRRELEERLRQLEFSNLSNDQDSTMTETVKFLIGLAETLRNGPPEPQRVALRRCLDRVAIEGTSKRVRLQLYRVPGLGSEDANINALEFKLSPANE